MNKVYTILLLVCLVTAINALCIENDGFMNIFYQGITLGHLNGELGMHTDYCSGNNLNEYICFGYNAEEIQIDCERLGMYCSEGKCVFEEPPIYQCTDSDNGIEPFTYGTVLAINNEFKGMAQDFCVDDKILHETYCNGIYNTAKVIDCSDYDMSCVEGICIELENIEENICTDSDEGMDPLNYGIMQLSWEEYDFPDHCINDNTLLEYYCLNNEEGSTEIINCNDYGMICVDNECKEEIHEENNPPELIYTVIQPIPPTPEEEPKNNLGCYVLVNDTDDELITVNIKWYRNNTYLPEFDETRECLIGENCQDHIGVEFPSGECDKWECEAVAFDGQDYSELIKSDFWGNWDETCEQIPHDCISECTSLEEPGYYELCENIEVENVEELIKTRCININADDIHLNCKDYSITKIGEQDYHAIYAFDQNNITIENCNLENWEYGLMAFTTTDSKFLNNEIEENTYGLTVYGYSQNNLFDSNNILNNNFGLMIHKNTSYNNYTNNIICNNEEYDINVGTELVEELENYFDDNTCTNVNTFMYGQEYYCDDYCETGNDAPTIELEIPEENELFCINDLYEEETAKIILGVEDAFAIDKYYLRLDDVGVGERKDISHPAILSLVDKDTEMVVEQTQIYPENFGYLGPDDEIKVYVYQTAPGITITSKWAELSVYPKNMIYYEWNGNDIDGDELEYTLHVNNINGERIRETNNEFYNLNVDAFGNYDWWVIANDGIDSTESEHWNFKVSKNPQVISVDPINNSEINIGDLIHFEFENVNEYHYDWEDYVGEGAIKDAWINEINVNVPALSPGEHWLTIILRNQDTCEKVLRYKYTITGCLTDDDCNSYDANYCLEDSIMHDEGVCVDYECSTETTETQNCNLLDEDFCMFDNIAHKDYTCEFTSFTECVLQEITTIENCNDGLYCNGQETCLDAECIAGETVDCTENNLESIETCLNDPDNVDYTWDYFAGFVSECNEDTDSCTIGHLDLTHECSVDDCSAECDAEHNCDDTICTDLSGCVGNDYYEYSDVSNTCKDDCTCTDNECGHPEIFENDDRCNTPPTVELISPENELGICGNPIEFIWFGEDKESTELEYEIHIEGPNKIIQITNEQTFTAELEQGIYTWYVIVNDGRLGFESEHWTFEVFDSPYLELISPPEYSLVNYGDLIFFNVDNYDYNDFAWDNPDLTREDSRINRRDFDIMVPDYLSPGEHNLTIRLDNGICVVKETYVFIIGDCLTNEDCTSYDANYCLEDSIMHDEGVCVDYECSIETTETQNCNLLDEDFCMFDNIMHKDYTCEFTSFTECILQEITTIENCNDGLY
ncbi:MAG: right-handed parallel beta-helix repeat-containing protein, partial [Candidatus Micrarchaeia archaeon]